MSAAQFAVRPQVPVPAVMVTLALALAELPLTLPAEQGPLAVIAGKVLALVVAVTVNVDW